MGKPSKQCPQCGSRIVLTTDADQIECAFCTATTLLISTDVSSPEQQQLSRNRAVDLSRFTIEINGADLEISWGWNRPKGVVAILIAVLFGWFGSVMFAGTSGGTDAMGTIWSLGVVILAVGLGYTSLALLVNDTRIAIQDRVLEATHGPLPYYLSQRLPLSQLQELRVHREMKKDAEGRQSVDHQLHARTTSGRTVKLIIHEDSAKVPYAVKTVLDAHIQRELSDDSRLSRSPAKSATSAAARADAPPARDRQKIVLICPMCGGLTPPPRKLTSSKCRYCAAELAIPDEIWQAVGLHPPRRRNIEHTPVTFVLRQQGRTLIATARWSRRGAFPLLMVTVLVACIAAIGFLLALGSDGWSVIEAVQGGTLLAILASLLVGIPAVGLAYVAICMLMNRTQVTVTSDRLTVWNGPLPLLKPRQLPAAKIKQVSIHRSSNYRRHAKQIGYDLNAISDYGATLELFTDQTELQGLQTVERLIERRLKIADRVVVEEIL